MTPIRRLCLCIAAILSYLSQTASDLPRFSVLTCTPGSQIYELEGHTALRMRFPDGRDYTANWGVFNFNEPNFVYRFVKGETDYIMAIEPTTQFLNRYEYDKRGVIQQDLILSEQESAALLSLIEQNALPQNRVYRYNYVKDNCATRPLSLIEKAISDTLTFNVSGSFSSFRNAMKTYHHEYPWYQFGIDLALGSGIDHPLTIREEAFAPVRLHQLLTNATRSNGSPIVRDAETLVQGSTGPAHPTPFLLRPGFICWTIFTVTLLSCLAAMGRKRAPVVLTSVLYTIFGLLGLITTFLIFVSTHEATSPNWLYLWINPAPLAIVALMLIKKTEKLAFLLQIINFVAVFLLLIIAAAGVQKLNSAFYPLIISDLMCSFTYIYVYRWQKKHLH